MNNADQEYFNLLNLVLTKGRVKKNRTGQNTLGVFGAQARFDLSEGFPLLTTKKVSFHNIVHELLWFLSGSTNIKYLVDKNVNIWNADCYKKYVNHYKQYTQIALSKFKGEKAHDLHFVCCDPISGENILRYFTLDEFVLNIKISDRFAAKWGDLGDGAYGQMWRAFPYSFQDVESEGLGGYTYCTSEGYVDQISKLIDGLKNNPDSRRHIVTAWHPQLVETVVLPPCHCLFQFHTEELTESERREEGINNWQKYCLPHVDDPYECFTTYDHDQLDSCGIPHRRLNCQLYQRSADLFLGVPYNIASYGLLTHMVAQVVNMVPGNFIYTFGDLHLYQNHLDQAREQLSREPRKLPTLKLNSEIKDIFSFTFDDIKLEGYNPHPVIKAEISV